MRKAVISVADKRIQVPCFTFAIFLIYSVIQIPSILSAQETTLKNSCVECHNDMWEEMQGSIHSRHGIRCDSCHGGDPAKDDENLAMAPEAGFIGIPDKVQIAEKCGSCHSDVVAMNFYGIPTDQLARYKTSRHGEMLFKKNDQNVASCSDCHGYHDVVTVKDSNSPVYPTHLPKTCNGCHGDKDLMKPYGLPADIYKKYRGSVHGIALFKKNDLSVANCASCHGSHGAIPPGVREVGATCGKCHINEKKYFLESVHAKVSERGGFSECISCHNNHDVTHASLELYRTACVKCHESQSAAFQQGQAISSMIQTAARLHKKAGETIRQASIKGFFVEKEEASLEEAKSDLVKMAPLQHTLMIDRIKELYDKVVSTTGGIEKSIARKSRNLKWRKTALIPLWIFVFVMAAALIAKYNRLKATRRKANRKGDG